jgi:hypothetical protein
MIYLLIILIILFISLFSFIKKEDCRKNNKFISRKYLLDEINRIYQRKPKSKELLDICKVVNSYQEKYNQSPTHHDLEKIILKYKIN